MPETSHSLLPTQTLNVIEAARLACQFLRACSPVPSSGALSHASPSSRVVGIWNQRKLTSDANAAENVPISLLERFSVTGFVAIGQRD